MSESWNDIILTYTELDTAILIKEWRRLHDIDPRLYKIKTRCLNPWCTVVHFWLTAWYLKDMEEE